MLFFIYDNVSRAYKNLVSANENKKRFLYIDFFIIMYAGLKTSLRK